MSSLKVIALSALPFTCRLHAKGAPDQPLLEAPPSKAVQAMLLSETEQEIAQEPLPGVTGFGCVNYKWSPPTEDKVRALHEELKELNLNETRVVLFGSILTASGMRRHFGLKDDEFVPEATVAEMLRLPHVSVVVGYANHADKANVVYDEKGQIKSVSATTWITTPCVLTE